MVLVCKLCGMSTMIFGPFKFVERLENAGLSREQASAIVEAQQDSLSEILDLRTGLGYGQQ